MRKASHDRYIGKVINGWMISCFLKMDNQGASVFQSVCNRCGNETHKTIGNFKRTKSCGCAKKKRTLSKDYAGEVFGDWCVVKYDSHNDRGVATFQVSCKLCGKKKIRSIQDLKRSTRCKCRSGVAQLGGSSQQNACYRTIVKKNEKLKERESLWISIEEMIDMHKMDCIYCGTNYTESNNWQGYKHNGIDRVNSSKGYIHGNVQPCCRVCNTIKGEMNHSDFIKMYKSWALKILKNT